MFLKFLLVFINPMPEQIKLHHLVFQDVGEAA